MPRATAFSDTDALAVCVCVCVFVRARVFVQSSQYPARVGRVPRSCTLGGPRESGGRRWPRFACSGLSHTPPLTRGGGSRTAAGARRGGCRPPRPGPLRDRARLVTPPRGPLLTSASGLREGRGRRARSRAERAPSPLRPQGARSWVSGNKGPRPPRLLSRRPAAPSCAPPLAREGGGGERAKRERRGRREEGGACVLLRRPAPGAPRRARLSSRGCSSCRFLTASAAAHLERPLERRAGGQTGARPRWLPSEAADEARRVGGGDAGGGGGGRRGPARLLGPALPP